MAPRSSSDSLKPVLSLLAGFALGGASALLFASRRKSITKRRVYPKHATGEKHFEIDSSLSQGNVEIGKLPLCQVLLCDDSRFRGWLILVPRKPSLKEVIDLSQEGQELLWKEVAFAMRVIQATFTIDKLNVSAVGNICPQLHIHVTGRTFKDAAWPNVHLGCQGRECFTRDHLQEVRRKLITGFQKDAEFQLIIEEDDEEDGLAKGKTLPNGKA